MLQIKLFLRKLLRVVEWLPVIWKGGDYDYKYSIDVFRYQLERTAKYIENHAHLENGERTVLQIRTAIDLIDKTYNGGYQDEAEEQFTRQYGECDVVFGEYDDDNFIIEFQWESAQDFDHNQEINDLHTAHMMAAYNKTQRGKEVLWKYINKHIDTWWD